MSPYRLPHALAGERERLELMSALLDPLERAVIDRLEIPADASCLELGSGNGSIARMLAQEVAPRGRVVASDIDLSYIAELAAPRLEVRRIDVTRDDIGEGLYDFVAARALLHHIPDARKAIERAVQAVKPGGVFLSIEPDMAPCAATEPESMREFWLGWLKWSAEAGIDYAIGRKTPAWLDATGLESVHAEGHTAYFNGGSDWARYWTNTLRELTPALVKSGHVTQRMLEECAALYADPHHWTSVITFVAAWGRKRS